jgi:hypothetical protein
MVVMLVAPALAGIPIAMFLYGTATADGENIAAGTTVYAVMDGVVVAIGAVDPNEDPQNPGTFLGGTYGQEAAFGIQADSDQAGLPVTFYIGGTPSLGQTPAQAGGQLATTDPAVALFQLGTLEVNLMLGEAPVEHTLLTSSTTCGNVTAPGDGNNGNNSYPVDTVVPLVATPDAGCCFVEWTGDIGSVADPSAASTTITMDADYSVVANFAAGVTLTTTAGTGGTVTTPATSPTQDCTGAVVDIVATPDTGYTFANWSGDTGTVAETGVASTTILMDASYSVQANFTAAPTAELTVSSGAGGSVTTPPEAGSPHEYNLGAVATIVATPDTGFEFTFWSGQTGTIANVNAASTTITMDADYSIMANFEATQAVPPEVTTVRSSSVRSTAVTLWGSLDSLGDYSPVDVSFEWGTTPGALDQETTRQGYTTTGDFVQVVGGLSPQTTYYFRARAGADSQVDYGTQMSFTTTATPTPAPPAPPQPPASPTATPEPTAEPTAEPTPGPTVEPTPGPTAPPTPPPIPTEEEVDLPVDEGGEVQGDVSHSGFDGSIGVDVGDGTVAQTAGGDPLTEITIREAALVYPNPNAGDCIVPPAYEFLPTGATFNPAITITLHYDETQLQALCPGVAEADLAIAMYKASAGTWQVLPSTVDTVNNVITAEVSSFCYLAVYAEGPEPSPTGPTPTQPPASPTATPEPDEGGGSVGAIVGGIIGALIVIAIIVFVMRRRGQGGGTPATGTGGGMPPPPPPRPASPPPPPPPAAAEPPASAEPPAAEGGEEKAEGT